MNAEVVSPLLLFIQLEVPEKTHAGHRTSSQLNHSPSSSLSTWARDPVRGNNNDISCQLTNGSSRRRVTTTIIKKFLSTSSLPDAEAPGHTHVPHNMCVAMEPIGSETEFSGHCCLPGFQI